jgi:hypothetical protein
LVVKERTDLPKDWLVLRDGDSWRAVGPGGPFLAARPSGWGRSPLEAYTALRAKYRMEGKLIELAPLDEFIVQP